LRTLGLILTALGACAWASAAAAAPTDAQCKGEYAACDAACHAADPKHSFSYAGCSAKCVASKAACDSAILYDDSSRWTKRQYEAAKPWVKKKAGQAEDLVKDAPNHTEHTYPSQSGN